MTERQPADPRARRTALLVLVGGAMVGATLIALAPAAKPALEAWLLENPGPRLTGLAVGVTVATVLPVVGLSVYLWGVAHRTTDAGRYPPPGLRLTHETVIVTGRAAHLRARAIRVLAASLTVAALLLAWSLWRLVATLRTAVG